MEKYFLIIVLNNIDSDDERYGVADVKLSNLWGSRTAGMDRRGPPKDTSLATGRQM